jgi:hypothetical protein
MKDFFAFLEEKKVAVIVGYIVFMILFYFIGIPRQSFGAFIVSFLIVTLAYLVFVFFFKKILFDKK